MGDCACHASDLHLQWDETNLAFLFLELTPACNNRCPGCSNVFATRSVEAPLSGDEWIKIIQRIKPYAQWLKLTGGEPTIHPDFEKVVTFLNRQEFPFRLLTNGRWANVESMLAFLIESPMLESLLISLHGPDQLSHEAFTNVRGSFDDAVVTIKRSTEATLKTATSTVITRHNWDRIEEMVEFALHQGADHLVFNRYIGAPLPNLEATNQQNIEALRKVEDLKSQGVPVQFGTPVPQCFFRNSTKPCLAGRAFATVDPWGKMRPCNHSSVIFGDLCQNTLEDILPFMVEWHAGVPNPCGDCKLLETCGAGCRAELTLRSKALRNPYMADLPQDAISLAYHSDYHCKPSTVKDVLIQQ